jgi:hypothetical protein
MAMTPELVLAEARNRPREQVAELLDHPTLELHHALAPEIEAAWREESQRRLTELETGQVQAIPGEMASNNIRRIVGR